MARKLSEEEMEEARETYLAGGVSMAQLAERYGVSVWTIRNYAQEDRWPTSRRIASASKRTDLAATDPSKAAANEWERRKEKEREKTYKGTSEALNKFYRKAPAPKSWKEAQIAQNLMDKAISPDVDADKAKGVNIAILNGSLNPFAT